MLGRGMRRLAYRLYERSKDTGTGGRTPGVVYSTPNLRRNPLVTFFLPCRTPPAPTPKSIMHLLALKAFVCGLCVSFVTSAPAADLAPRRQPTAIQYQVPNTQTTLFIRLGGLVTQAALEVAIAATHQAMEGMIQQFGGDSTSA